MIACASILPVITASHLRGETLEPDPVSFIALTEGFAFQWSGQHSGQTSLCVRTL